MNLLVAFYGFFGLFAGVVLGARLGARADSKKTNKLLRNCLESSASEIKELRRRFDIDLGMEYGKGWNAHDDFVRGRIAAALSLPRMPEQDAPEGEVSRDDDTTFYHPHG
jgi:hypothetical protein